MPIDWFTVAAQALNFLVLVWLMKRFLYRPILDAIDAREKRIAAELAAAAATMEEARAQREEFQHKNEKLVEDRAGFLKTATVEAAAERQRLLDEAREAANAFATKSREALREEIHGLEQTVARKTREEVFAITRKALGDLAAVSLENQMATVFCQRLRDMENGEKELLSEELRTSTDPGLMRTSFEIKENLRDSIRDTLAETFGADLSIRFETAPELIGGIELIASGRKIAWSIAGYLASLESALEVEAETH